MVINDLIKLCAGELLKETRIWNTQPRNNSRIHVSYFHIVDVNWFEKAFVDAKSFICECPRFQDFDGALVFFILNLNLPKFSL